MGAKKRSFDRSAEVKSFKGALKSKSMEDVEKRFSTVAARDAAERELRKYPPMPVVRNNYPIVAAAGIVVVAIVVALYLILAG